MDRRRFLRTSGLVSTALLAPRFVRAMDVRPMAGDRKLVIVQLSGGNDGLNTVVPFVDDAYYNARPQLAIPPAQVLRLTDEVGLNAGMEAFQRLFLDGRMTILNGVGYPDPDRSHFRSMDIWHTASGSDTYLETGWLGRYLDGTKAAPHEVVEFGGALSLANKGAERKAIAISDPQRFYATTREPYFAALAGRSHEEDHQQLGYLYRTMVETYESAGHIHEHLRPRGGAVAYPATPLGQQLKHVGDFIRSGIGTRVFYTSMSGFDTHVAQQGKHQKALSAVSEAVGAFMKDMKEEGLSKEVVVMVFSEFGRRVKQNASQGTDHGTAGNVFLLGEGLVHPGLFNAMSSLSTLDDNGDLRFSVDFRSIYVALLEQWLRVPAGPIVPGGLKAPKLLV